MTVNLTFARIYTHDLDGFLAELPALGMPQGQLRFTLPANGIEVCLVGGLCIVAGNEEALAPYRHTATTFVVDDLQSAFRSAIARGGEVVQPPKTVPTGANATVRVAGVQIELVEWSSAQWSSYRAATG